MGCDIGFVVPAPFALAEKCMRGEVRGFKEPPQYFCLGRKKTKPKKHEDMCEPLDFREF